MYQLKCGDVSSVKTYNKLANNTALREKICKTSCFELISILIFNNIDIREDYFKILSALILGDEWKIPISKKYADILFFSLCCNCNSKSNVKITNISQAISLFEESGNDYSTIEMIDEDKKMRFEEYETTKFPCLFPGTKISFKIPVRFFRNKKTGKTNRTLGNQPFFKISINDGDEVQVPRHLLIGFFSGSLNNKGSISIVVEQTEKIASKFEYNSKALWNVLLYLGYNNNKTINQQFTLPLSTVFLDNGYLISIVNNNCRDSLDNSLWEDLQGGRKIFLPKAEYVLFSNNNGNYVVLVK